MSLRSGAMVPSTASRVLIHINEYKPNVMAGVLHNPYLDVYVQFFDVVDFANKLDAMFDTLSFPQASMEYRSFSKKRGKKTEKDKANASEGVVPMETREKLSGREEDTFIVHVQFRQNATWQGTIKWAEQKEERYFRSTLEMLKIMDSVLEARHPEDTM